MSPRHDNNVTITDCILCTIHLIKQPNVNKYKVVEELFCVFKIISLINAFLNHNIIMKTNINKLLRNCTIFKVGLLVE